ncbi:hypothetical protein HNR06_001030 [Nocardiopsis arvandica]|uniref:Uncharacterized protein n=1 Tax=Nocardiopsis sinuspersici TaxID=501010 RepID=A0A7Y9X900_9ACTN|nr:hypothetical protein [Nocardiopsis sinuspersici]
MLVLASGADAKVASGEPSHATTHFTQGTYQSVFPEAVRAAVEVTAEMLKPTGGDGGGVAGPASTPGATRHHKPGQVTGLSLLDRGLYRALKPMID